MQTAFLHVTKRHESDSVELQEFVGTFHCTQSRLERGEKANSVQCQKNTRWFIDGVGEEISGLLKTDCNVIASVGAGKMERGILVREWHRLNGHERCRVRFLC